MATMDQTDIRGFSQDNFSPGAVPVTLLGHDVRKYESACLADQVYLNPHPDELMLLNHL
jgi:uncharacterized protein YbgA (DUF1722 family)